MKRFLGVAAMALSVFSAAALPSAADAVCNACQALPMRVTLSGTTCYVYFRPMTSATASVSLASNYGYGTVSTATTTGAAMCMMATDAVTHQTRITVTGDAAACPSPPTATGTIGTITYLSVNP